MKGPDCLYNFIFKDWLFQLLVLIFIDARMDGLLDNDYVIHDLPAGNEASLCFRNNLFHDFFHSCRKDFGKNFVGGIT